MFFIQVLQVDFLADFQFTLVYTGLLFLPPDGFLNAFNQFLKAFGQSLNFSMVSAVLCLFPWVGFFMPFRSSVKSGDL